MTAQDPFYKQLETKRKAQNITLLEISERTKIREEFLAAIEQGNFPILPSVYVRLFLKSYAIEIGADPDKVIEDYEIHTTGTISQKSSTPDPPVEVDFQSNESKSIDLSKSSTFNRKALIRAVITIVVLFILFKLVGELTHDVQTSDKQVTEDPAFTDEIQSAVDTYEEIGLGDTIQDIRILDESVFFTGKLISTENVKLNLTMPLIFTVKAMENTQVHIGAVESDSTIFDQNKLLPKDSSMTVESTDQIKFDLWKSNHVEVSINGIRIDNRFSHDNVAVRASIVADGSLFLSYYNH